MQAGTDPDTAAIDASRRGDVTAFANIIERYHRAVYAVAYSGVRDRARADDVTQDTFVLAWRRLDDLRDPDRLGAWLCGIARNLARDARRRMQRETVGDVAEPVDPVTPLSALTDAETERIIAVGLEQVPDVYREPLVMFYYQDRSVEDVARTLGISPATTNKRLSRGRRYLAERVETVLERGLARRGPSAALASAVIAAIGIGVGPAAHVDASPLKGSTMSKLVIAAVVTTAVVAGGFIVAHALGGSDAHAESAANASSQSGTQPGTQPGADDVGDEHCLADFMTGAAKSAASDRTRTGALSASAAPSLAGSSATATQANDCATVGRHLAELEADATHGPEHRPDEATCEQCASHYTTMCQTQNWSTARRACSLAAGDLLNAQVCAAANETGTAPTGNLAPELQCSTLAQHIATTVQGAGLYTEMPDMAQQVDAACQLGGWSLELRQCFAAAQSPKALEACVAPAPAQESSGT